MKKMRFVFLLGLALLAAWGVPAFSAGADVYRYISAGDLKAKLESGEPPVLIDIQVEPEFALHHIPGALATYAYPVKSGEERARLDLLLPELQASGAPIVIVCPRGAGGAKRAYDHLLAQGVGAERLLILEKGQEGWPYPELTESAGH